MSATWQVTDEDVRQQCREHGQDPDELTVIMDGTGCGTTTWGAIYGPFVGATVPTCGKRPVVEVAGEQSGLWFPLCAEHAGYQPPSGMWAKRSVAWPISVQDARAIADRAHAEAVEHADKITTAGWMAGVADALRYGSGIEPTMPMRNLARTVLGQHDPRTEN